MKLLGAWGLLLAVAACGPGLADGRYTTPSPAPAPSDAASSCTYTAFAAPVTTHSYYDPALSALQRIVSSDDAGNRLVVDVHGTFGDAAAIPRAGDENTVHVGSADPNACGICVSGERAGQRYLPRSGTLLVRTAAAIGGTADVLLAQLVLEGPAAGLGGVPPTWCFFSTLPLVAPAAAWPCDQLGVDGSGSAACWADSKTQDSVVARCENDTVTVMSRCAAGQACAPGKAPACAGP